eukprot:GFUD01028225.1.p1 GENE.GFUD01028225.1~~GFUD01028225.1.p1  ORF type:complete len:279 (+),score=92.17 GFUD01028225.1:53-889(+)
MSRLGAVGRCLVQVVRSSTCQVIMRPTSSMLRVGQLLARPDLGNMVARASIHCSAVRRDLSDFFEVEKFRGEKVVRVGREWRKDELRLKSNTDLHKLWFILLKERNMLLTMQDAYTDEFIAMPNPERVDKVELSMEHLEEVVRERNKAFYQLEVGVSGERERVFRQDCFGRVAPYKKREHVMPFRMNTGYRQKLRFRFLNTGTEDVLDFQARLREKMALAEKGQENVQMRMAARVLRRFPNSSLVALQEKFPLVKMERLTRWRKVVGEAGTKETGWDV